VATITPILRTAKTNADGHHPIWLRFADTNRTLYASLGVYIALRYWNERKNEVRKGHPHSERINQLIQRRLAEAEDERLRLLMEREPVTAEALKQVVQQSRTPGSPCFLAYADEAVGTYQRQGNVGRYKLEKGTLNKLRAYSGSPLPFTSITPDFLRRYETHLVEKHENKASTVQRDMKVIRAHFRRAVDDGLVSRDADPFLSYSAPKAKRAERHRLSAEELARIERLDLGGSGEAAPLLARVRDAFLFSLYCAGVRFADVARLRCENIRVDESGEGETWRLAYTMGKTGKRATLQLIPQARRIVAAYLIHSDGTPKDGSDFLFPMLTGADLSTARSTYNAISSQNALHNKYLTKLAKRAKVKGKLSFHVARHSFADLARRRGWDVYAISKALAHSGLAITERYLAGFDAQLVDARMDQLFGSEG
jgi:integrase